MLLVPAAAGAATSASSTSSAALGKSTLRRGDTGAAVKALQRLLTRAGFKTTADGQFGSGTAKVLRRFQRAADLKATGVADAATVSALRRATNGSASRNTNGGFGLRSAGGSQHLGDRIPLQQGMSGHDVRILQDFLTRAGFKTGIDGEFGAGTLKSVKLFETDRQVAQDGIVDAADIDLLRSLVAGDGGAPATAAQPPPLAPGDKATIGADGLAVAPASAPDPVKQIIAAGNEIAKTPYHYGGGHGTWQDTGYDCSGSVSYALHGAGLLDQALPSGDFTSWGEPGPGQWVTLYANGGHIYMMVAGLRYDTSGRQQDGTRWHADTRSSSGYTAVHPPGL
ncbi:peptidoglycan-binding domain-containing protein [Baekduia soli]|uniref:peptidoglycan-binding domain-containing protein n=1 Tax=Baekduia soli TaxID=496014 RepID=UPI00165225EE|nr:peptidoglycan-binding protein [Baekduia soli]